MAVRIRLRKTGKSAKKDYHFRIVVADQRRARDGRFIEEIGFYNPSKKPMLLKLDLDRVEHWLKCGAVPSETVTSLIKKAKKEKK